MRKFLLLPLLLLIPSCIDSEGFGCAYPSYYSRTTAQSYYDTFGTVLADDAEEKEAIPLFGCHYHKGDRVYVYKTFWGKKYILVRYGRVITFEEKK